MLRILFMLLLGLHGLIHIMGFVKAFNLAEIKELKKPVSRSYGVIWLLTFMLFTATLVQFMFGNQSWWLTAFMTILVSQTVIVVFWQDAKFGTIPNIVILLVAIPAFAQFSFNKTVTGEIDQMFAGKTGVKSATITTERLAGLPAPVQKWLSNSGIVGRKPIHTVRLKQTARMKMDPEQEDWTAANAVQYYTVDPPAFVWQVEMEMMPLVNIVGRDKFMAGKGEMLIKALSLFPVVDAGDNDRINSGTLQRYLGEIVWFPSAALSDYITWEPVDSLTAQATMTWDGTTGSGLFYFSEAGEFRKFSAQRWMGSGNDATLHEWIITAHKSDTFTGIRIPVDLEATWKLESGDWTWLRLKIIDIEYNITHIY